MFKHLIYILPVIFVFLGSGFSSDAQTSSAEEVMRKIRAVYKNLDHFSMEATCRLFEDYVTTFPLETETIILKKTGNSIYNEASFLQLIANPDYCIRINNRTKTILVSTRQDNNTSNKKNSETLKINMSMDDLLLSMGLDTNDYGEDQYSFMDTEKPGIRAVKFTPAEGDYREIIYYFSTKDSLFSNIILYYKNPIPFNAEDNQTSQIPRMEITYFTTLGKENVDKGVFDEKNYIKINGSLISGIGKYSDYKINNYINK